MSAPTRLGMRPHFPFLTLQTMCGNPLHPAYYLTEYLKISFRLLNMSLQKSPLLVNGYNYKTIIEINILLKNTRVFWNYQIKF